MRHRAANRAAIARLCMPDPRQRGGKKRLARNEVRVLLDVALSNGGADADCTFSAFDAIKARQMSMTTLGRAMRMLSMGISVCPPARTRASVPSLASTSRTSSRLSART